MFAQLMWLLPTWCHDLVWHITGWRVMKELDLLRSSNGPPQRLYVEVKDGSEVSIRHQYDWIRRWPPEGCDLIEEE